MGFKEKVLDFLSKPVEIGDYETLGVKFSEQAALRDLAVHVAISYIANAISKCEIKTYEDGEEVQNELYYMLNVNPNPNQNSSQFMNELVERLFYKGEALVVPWRKKFLYVSRGWSMEEVPRRENLFTSVDIEGESLNRKFKSSDVFYFKLDNKHVRRLIDLMYSDYGALIDAAMKSFKAKSGEKWKLALDNYAAGDPKFKQDYENVIKKQLEVFLESDRAVYPQFRGTDLQLMTQSGGATSADVVSLRKDAFETVSQAFHIPLSMMQGNITNVNDVVKQFLTFAVEPVAQMISEELTRKTTDYDTWKSGNHVKIDTTTINSVDILEVADSIDKLIGSGAFTINNVLKRCGYDIIAEDYADKRYLTKNYGSIENVTNPLEGGESENEA